MAIRYLTAGTHSDHNTICKFRRENLRAFRESFVDVLELGILRLKGFLRHFLL